MTSGLEQLNSQQRRTLRVLTAALIQKSLVLCGAITYGFWHRMACLKNCFFMISPYENWSSYYAMAVIELGRAVAHEVGAHAR